MGTKTLVVESTPLSPLTQTFNPFSATSTGYTLHSTNLYYEPLFFFNILNPNQAPVPMLATAYSFSNGGKTLTLTTRSGVKWSDGKPFSAADVAFTFNLIAKNPALAQTGTPAPDQRHRHRAEHGGAQLRPAAGREPVPHRHPGHRVPARLAVGEQPVHLRRRQPGRHRAVRPGQVHPAGHPAQGEPALLEQERDARARGGLPVLRQQHRGRAGARIRSDRLGGQLHHERAERVRRQGPGAQQGVVRQHPVHDLQQRRHAVAEHHQGAAERPQGPAGDQLRRRPAAARRPGRDRL